MNAFTVTLKLNAGTSGHKVVTAAAEHLLDGEHVAVAGWDQDVAVFSLTTGMTADDTEQWAADLAEDTGAELVAVNPAGA